MLILSNPIPALNVCELQKFLHLKRNWAEEHDGDIRFKSGSGNMAVLCTQNPSGHNYRNRSVIVGGICYGADTTFHTMYF